MNYYTLLIKNPETKKWSVEFGDFDRETVEEERDITWREGEDYKLKDTKIIKTAESQDEIDKEVTRLNNKAKILPSKDELTLTQERRIRTIQGVNFAIREIIRDIAYDYVQENWDTKVNGDLKKKHHDYITEYLQELKFRIETFTEKAYDIKVPIQVWYQTDHLVWDGELKNPKIIFQIQSWYKDGPYTQSYIKEELWVQIQPEPLTEEKKHEIKKTRQSQYPDRIPGEVYQTRREIELLELEKKRIEERIYEIQKDFGSAYIKTR